MRTRQEHTRVAWASVIVVTLAAGAWIWATPHDEPESTALRAGTPAAAAATSTSAPLPSPRLPSATDSLPPFAAAFEPAQSLVTAPSLAQPSYPIEHPTLSTGLATLDLTLVQPGSAPAAGLTLSVWPPQFGPPPLGGPPLVTDATGRIVLGQLSADVPIRLIATDRLGDSVLDLKLMLAAGERRDLSATIQETDRCEVIVQVADRSGVPVADAMTTLVATPTRGETRPVETMRARTSPGGLAEFEVIAAESVSISVSHDGFAPAWLSDVPLDRSPLWLELTLDAGFPVEVEVVDTLGRPRDVDVVELRGSPVAVQAQRIDLGLYRFESFPEAATGITASVRSRLWQIDHAARQHSARIVVPASGALSASWDPARVDCQHARIVISTDPPGWDWTMEVHANSLKSGGPVLLDELAPGDYLIELKCSALDRDGHPTRATVYPEAITGVLLEP